jgi:hypothetical protein
MTSQPAGEPPYKKRPALAVAVGASALALLVGAGGGGAYWWLSRNAATATAERPSALPLREARPPAPSPDAGATPAVVDSCARVQRCCGPFYVARGLAREAADSTCAQMAAVRAQATGAMLETVCAAQMQAFEAATDGIPLPPECR